VLLQLLLKGAPAGEHALHIHAVGKCEPPGFDSAGGHFDPANAHYGMMSGPGHAGDMPNLHVPASGALDLEVLNTSITLDKDKPNSVFGEDAGPATRRGVRSQRWTFWVVVPPARARLWCGFRGSCVMEKFDTAPGGRYDAHRFLERLLSSKQPPTSVLEIGCGTGSKKGPSPRESRWIGRTHLLRLKLTAPSHCEPKSHATAATRRPDPARIQGLGDLPR
jgi:hypothetical protein